MRHDVNPCQKLLRRGITLAALLALTAAVVTAQDWSGRGRAQGRVTDGETGQPLAGVKITLLKDGVEGQGPPPLWTDKKGRWTYLGLVNGSWTVLLDLAGYMPSRGAIQVSEFQAGKPANVEMRPIPKDTGKEAADERRQRLNEGNQLLAAGKYAEARAAYEDVLAELEDEASKLEIRQAIAQTYYGQKDYATARGIYQEVMASIEDVTKHPPLLQNIARSYYEEGDVDQAVATLEQALQVAPGDVATLQLTINLLVASDREDEAQKFVALLPAGEKVDPNALLNMGIKLYNENDLDAALEKFNRAVEENPNLADVYYYRGLVYLAQEKSAEALADFKKLLELKPDHPNAAEAQQFAEYLESKQ